MYYFDNGIKPYTIFGGFHMKKLTALVLTMAILSSAFLFSGCGAGDTAPAKSEKPAEPSAHEAVEVRIAHGLTETDPVHIGFEAFAKSLEAADVNMTVKIFPNGQLSSSDRDLIEGVQFGEFDITSVAASNLANTIPEFFVFNANFLFDSLEDARDTLLGEKGQGFVEQVNADSNTGIRTLGFFGGTMQSIWTTKKPLPDAASFANVKIRSAENPINIAELQALKATPTPVAWGELYTALQQGTVDGLFSNRVTAVQQFGDVLKYGTFIGHNLYLPIPIASQAFYDKLDAEQKVAFDEATKAACEAQWASVFELDESIVEDLKARTEDGTLEYIFEMESEALEAIKPLFIDSTEEMVAELGGEDVLAYWRG